MFRARLALALGMAMTGAAVAVVLSQSPPTVLASNASPMTESRISAATRFGICQSGERLPQDTDAIRLSVGQFVGSTVMVRVFADNRLIASGTRGPYWAGRMVTVPVSPLAHEVEPVKICVSFPAGGEQVTIFWRDGRMRIEYLGASRSSWLTLVPTVAANMGFGRAWSGIWIAFLVLMLTLAATILAAGLVIHAVDE